MKPSKCKNQEDDVRVFIDVDMEEYANKMKEAHCASLTSLKGVYDKSMLPVFVGVDTGTGESVSSFAQVQIDPVWAKEVDDELNSEEYKRDILDKTFTIIWDHLDTQGQLSDTNIHRDRDTRANKLFSDREQFTGKELTLMLRAAQKIREINVITEDGLLRILKVIPTDGKRNVLLRAEPVDLPSGERKKLSQMMVDVIGKMPAEDLARIFPDMLSGSIIQELIKHKLS